MNRLLPGIFLQASLLAAILLLGACTDLSDPNLDGRVEGVLARHPQGPEIGRWYATLPAGSLEREAAQWILAWLPDSDLVSLDLMLLQEHVTLACRAYRESPWRESLPRATWLHFVVPHRVSQEPLQPWRRVMAEELAAVVAPYRDMERAALAVNRWCRQQATYTPTSGRDMGPLTTMKRGLGRCEEEMILTVCAMRAAGIPARTCSTPYWTFTDDNHAWVEVWVNGGWYYAESCDDRRCLNDSWFSGSASRAGFVDSEGYGEFDPSPEPLYRAENGVTVVNSTAVYTTPFTVRARVAGHPDAPVFVNVLNYGTLRAIARVPADGSLVLGPGSFALTAQAIGDDAAIDDDTATGDSGGLLLKVITGQSGDTLDVVLDPVADLYDAEAGTGFWLTYPEEDADRRRHENLVSDATDRHHRLLVAAGAAERGKLRQLDETEQAVLDSLPADLRAEWDAILEKPCAGFAPFIRLLTWYRTAEQRQALTWLLADGDDKDLLELDERMVRAHVDGALAARGSLPDDVWREGVLCSRIQREPAKDWRSALPAVGADPDAVLAAFGRDWVRTERRYFGNPLTPDEVFLLGRGTETDLKVAFVGLCRANGVPARYRHGQVQWWREGWQDVDPLDQNGPGQNESAGEAAPTGNGWLDLTITHGGLPWPQAESYRHFMISRQAEGRLETPWWGPVQGLQEWPAGDYWCCATLRVPGGSACGRLKRFSVAADETTVVTLSADLEEAGWDPAVLVDADLAASFADLDLVAPTGGLYFLFQPGEPATRMLPVIARLQERLRARDLPVVPVLVGGRPAEWRRNVAEAGLTNPLVVEQSARVRDWLAGPAQNGPVTVLVLPGVNDGRPVLLRRGLDNGIDFAGHLALDAYPR